MQLSRKSWVKDFCLVYHIFFLLGLSVGIFLLASNGSFVAAISVSCFDSWSLWWGETHFPQLSPFADAYVTRHLERAPFNCFQILIFQMKRLQLLPFLTWSLSQCDFWTFFWADFHHAFGVNLYSPSRLLWFIPGKHQIIQQIISSMVRYRIWNLTHHQSDFYDKVSHIVQQSSYRLFIGNSGFLNNVPESRKVTYYVYHF